MKLRYVGGPYGGLKAKKPTGCQQTLSFTARGFKGYYQVFKRSLEWVDIQ